MIKINDFSFRYSKQKTVFDNLTLHLASGSIYGLLGRNGAGKSTLLKNLAGLLFPTEGVLSVNQCEPRKRQPSFLQSVYFIPEQVYVPSLSVKRYVDVNAVFYPHFSSPQFYSYLAAFDVKKDGKLSELSFGQQKKFIIAFGLACNTPVLLMDEPTNGLDIPSKSQFRKLIAAALTDAKLFLISTHQTRDLDNLIDQIIIVEDGALVLNASINAISDKLSFKMVKELPESAAILYAESALNGHTIVLPNTEGVETPVHLELLFNAAIEQPERMKMIFNN